MKLIAAADRNWAIGKDGGLLASISEDMKFFRQMTTGHVVVMGRKTLESFPQGQPLPKRVNVVLTHKKDYKKRGTVVVHSEEELRKELSKYKSDDIFVIGGGSMYRMLLPYCDTAYITRIDYSYEADTWMPNLEEDPNWHLVEEGEERACFDLIYHFTVYQNASPRKFGEGEKDE